MDWTRMLERCTKESWRVDDLDWCAARPSLARDDEIAICQGFTDMSGIELLAAALFEVQRDRARDPVLHAIFASFVEDERRHAEVARRLARHYDVHRYRDYEVSPQLVQFHSQFVAFIEHVSPALANDYVTTGELLLDIAYLRALEDFGGDALCRRAMERIDRDEARHIAVDLAMTELYASERALAAEKIAPKTLTTQLRGALTSIRFLYTARLFLRDVFFAPMQRFDPEGRRMLRAFKQVQLLSAKRRGADAIGSKHPFVRFHVALRSLANHDPLGPVFRKTVSNLLGVPPTLMTTLYADDEVRRARSMSYEAFSEQTLRVSSRDRRTTKHD